MAEKSLSIALKGRDESAAAFASVEKRISGISGASIAKMAGTFFAIGGLAKAAAAGVMGVMAANKAAIADQEQSATGLLEAQIKANAAWAELAGALPMIGESAKKIMETLGDNEGIRAQIAVIKDLEKEYGRLTETLKKWRQENELRAAQAAGKSDDEVEAIRARHALEERATTIESARVLEKKAKDALLKAEGLERATVQAMRGGTAYLLAANDEERFKALKFPDSKLLDKYKAIVKVREDLEAESAAKTESETTASARKAADSEAKVREERYKDSVDAETRELQASFDKYTKMGIAAINDEELHKWVLEKGERERLEIIEKYRKIRMESEAKEIETRRKNQELINKAQTKAAADSMAAFLRNSQTAINGLPKITPIPGASGEVSAFQSRFLTRAPGRDDPAWVRQMNQNNRRTNDLLSDLNTNLPDAIGKAVGRELPAININ